MRPLFPALPVHAIQCGRLPPLCAGAFTRPLTHIAAWLLGNLLNSYEQGSVGLTQSSHSEEYNSHNTTRFDVAGMKALLLKLDFMQRIARGEHATAED